LQPGGFSFLCPVNFLHLVGEPRLETPSLYAPLPPMLTVCLVQIPTRSGQTFLRDARHEPDPRASPDGKVGFMRKYDLDGKLTHGGAGCSPLGVSAHRCEKGGKERQAAAAQPFS
jgi:hypothetical protein